MKKAILVVVLVLIGSFAFAAEPLQKTLENGMTIVTKENKSNSSVGLFCFVKTGSINEGQYLGAGISHYLEHIVSGGTTSSRTEDDYAALGKEMGAMVNAYTTAYATAYHIVVDKKYKDEALKMLSEQVTDCAFSEKEIDREKKVIQKEFVFRSTPPRAKMRQKANEIFFPKSNRRYPVIGYINLFNQITNKGLEDYYRKRYVPNNMIFVAVGDFDATEMLQQLEDTFKDVERAHIQPVALPIQNKQDGEFEFIEEFEIQMPVVEICTIVDAADFCDRTELDMAIDVLFSKRQSPIRYKLVEELKLVNYVYAYVNCTNLTPEGSIHIAFEAKDPANVKEIVAIIDEEFEKYAEKGFTQKQIDNYRNRLNAGLLLYTPTVENDCQNLGWSIMSAGVPDATPARIAELETITPADMHAAIRKHILPKDRSIFYAMPKDTKSILEEAVAANVVKEDVKKIQLKDELTLLYRKNTEKPIVRAIVHLKNSTEYETEENFGTIEFMTNLMIKGSKKYKPLDLSEWLEDHVVDLDISASYGGTSISFECLKKDFDDVKEIVIDAMNRPTFDEKEFMLAMDAGAANLKRAKSDPSSMHRDFRASVLYEDTKNGLSMEDQFDILSELEREDLFDIHKKYFNAQEVIVTLFGDLTESEAKKYANEIFKKVPNKKINETINPLTIPDVDEVFVNEYDFEQVNVDINTVAPKLGDSDYYTMKVIESLLTGARGRLHHAVRGDSANLAYFAHAYYSGFHTYGFFRATSQTSIDKKDDLVQTLVSEFNKLKTERVADDEIKLAIEENEQLIKSYLTDNFMPTYITHYEALGLGYDHLTNSSKHLNKVTAEDIQRVAKKYFKNLAVIVSYPDETVEKMVN